LACWFLFDPGRRAPKLALIHCCLQHSAALILKIPQAVSRRHLVGIVRQELFQPGKFSGNAGDGHVKGLQRWFVCIESKLVRARPPR